MNIKLKAERIYSVVENRTLNDIALFTNLEDAREFALSKNKKDPHWTLTIYGYQERRYLYSYILGEEDRF